MKRQASYLHRLWNDGKHHSSWRTSLEDVRTHDTQTFATLTDLLKFLEQLQQAEKPDWQATTFSLEANHSPEYKPLQPKGYLI